MNILLLQSAIKGRSKDLTDDMVRRLSIAYKDSGIEWPELTHREQALIELAAPAGSTATLQILNEHDN